MSEQGPLVEAVAVSKTYSTGGEQFVALREVSFGVRPGRTLAVLGESGAGKSTLTRLLAGLDQPTSGQVLLDGAPSRRRRGRPSPIQMVFQDPSTSFDPRRRIGLSVQASLRRLSQHHRRLRSIELLRSVGLDADVAELRPRQLSGGQLQRVGIARALAAQPRVLVCDEPTSALDVSIQAQILNLILKLQHEDQFACIVVTHDLGVARVLADDILLLRVGAIVEQGPAATFFASPSSDYGRTLLDAFVL